MLICNVCYLLSGFWLVISELPEKDLALRTCSPGLVGTYNFKMVCQKPAVGSCVKEMFPLLLQSGLSVKAE